MSKETRYKLVYIIYCVSSFSSRYGMNDKQAFAYLYKHKGIEFLDECYEAEHQLSLDDAVNDLTAICKRNGGNIG